ncbi:MAG: endonuclease [Candidatus Symbiothrix sp.]|nr:endonuclease [Candidatus Symbiothrix sp.]
MHTQSRYIILLNKALLTGNALFFLLFSASAQIPAGYYNSAFGKKQAALKTAMYNVIKDHDELTYKDLWTAFQTTDVRNDGKVWDMYSNCTFTFVSEQCGNYNAVCDCYNREHSFPKSWFNDAYPMYTDLFHLYPTDGKVNGYRSNYPFGMVANNTQSELNGTGTKLGQNTIAGYTGIVFEPADEYKGDFARSYFYMVTRYENVVASWYGNAEAKPTINGTAYPAFQSWAITMLLQWNAADPVSQKEIDRNNEIYTNYQHNRNPYIDFPQLAEYVWGDSITFAFNPYSETDLETLEVFEPLACFENACLQVKNLYAPALLRIYNMQGQTVWQAELSAAPYQTSALPQAVYVIQLIDRQGRSKTTRLFNR